MTPMQLLALEERLYRTLDSTKWILGVASGYAGALALNVLPEVKSMGLLGAARSVFFETPVHVALTSVVLTIGALWLPLRVWLRTRASRRTIDHQLLAGFKQFRDDSLRGHELEGIAWGLGQTVLASPKPQSGWKTSEISFTIDRTPFSFKALEQAMGEPDFQDGFINYKETVFPQQFSRDAPRVMLTNRPSAFTDDEGIHLAMKYTSWSRLQYFWRQVVNSTTRPRLVDMAFNDETIEFPNTLTLHLVVKTADSKILITKAHRLEANDHPSTWACSVGEQIDPSDLQHLNRDCASLWVARALREELEIQESEFDAPGVRFLALTLEADIVNFAFIAIATINLSADALEARLKVATREDNEFSSLAFMDVGDIPRELVRPSREYHPSTPIRMIYTYIFMRGQSQLRQALLREFNKMEPQ